jgi:UDP-apiose/xylose synthase
MTSPARIAVLGAGGFLGSHLVPALLRRTACEIDVVDLAFDKLDLALGADLSPVDLARVHRRQARVEDPAVVDEIVGRCATVVSLTALCNPALYNTEPLAVIDANYTHLVPLVSACTARRRRLIHFSTCEVYGRVALDVSGAPAARMNEASTGLFLGPVSQERWTYACAKQLLERLIWAHGQHRGLEFTIIRPFNVIGARMDFVPGIDGEGIPRVLASFMGALLRGEPLPLVDGGQQRRSFIAVEDFVEAVVRVVERPAACRGAILNLGHPSNDVSIRVLASKLGAVYATVVPGAPRASTVEISAEAFYGAGYDDTRERIPDVDLARRLLDWEPKITLDDMLPGIVADYVNRYQPRLGAEQPVPRAAGAGRR